MTGYHLTDTGFRGPLSAKDAAVFDASDYAVAQHAARVSWCRQEAQRIQDQGGPRPFFGSRTMAEEDRFAFTALEHEPPPEDEDGEWLPPLF